MSEDEDSYRNGVLVPNEFISRPPSYQSVEVSVFGNFDGLVYLTDHRML